MKEGGKWRESEICDSGCSVKGMCHKENLTCWCWLWRRGKRAMSQWMGQPLHAGKVMERDSPLEPSERNTALQFCQYLDFSQVRSILKLVPNSKIRNVCCFKPPKYVVICYSSSETLTQLAYCTRREIHGNMKTVLGWALRWSWGSSCSCHVWCPEEP